MLVDFSISHLQQTVHGEPRSKFPMHSVDSAPAQLARHPICACVSLEEIIEMEKIRMQRRRAFIVIKGEFWNSRNKLEVGNRENIYIRCQYVIIIS